MSEQFLAAMSSSRSDVVTQCVFPCFRVSVPFFSFNVLEVSASPKVFQWCFNGVSRPFKVCLCLKFKVSRMFQTKVFKGVLRKFQGCFNPILYGGCFSPPQIDIANLQTCYFIV